MAPAVLRPDSPSAPAVTPERVLRRLEWRVLRRLDGRLQGDFRTAFRGAGVDFLDLREYEQGDDLRHIDWNVTARTDTPHVRQYLEDRELTAWLLLDRSASMGFGPVDRQKQHVMVDVAVTMTQLFARGGNPVGAMLFDNAVRQTIRPAHGRHQVLRITRELLTPLPEPSVEGAASTDLSVLLKAASGVIRRRSMVIVVSDFISEPGWERPLAQLARRHDVIALQVTDPREFELPSVGMVYVEDAETGEQIFVDTDDPGFRERLRAAAEERQEQVTALARSAGVELHPVSTDEDLVRSLVRVTELRRKARR